MDRLSEPSLFARPCQDDDGGTMIPATLENAIYGLVSTPALYLADKHGIFRFLIDEGPADSATLADRLGVDRDTAQRLLLVLVAFGVLRIGTDGTYSVPPDVTPYLDRRDERYVGAFVEHLIAHTPTRLPRLDTFMTKGKAVAEASQPGPFETFYRDEQATRAFVEAMWNLSYASSHQLARLADLRDDELLVDVGGASGPVAIVALLHRPRLRAVVFDLPPVEPYLRQAGRTHGVADRLDFVPGDFFNDDLPEGDCVAFGYVLSDWTDATCVDLLRKAYRACRPGGRVLIMDRLFDDDRRGPLATAVMNLEMHVETQGRHRTGAEYGNLLAETGFEGATVRRSSQEKHLVIGHKPPMA
jgi:SAM-dependent methyltransferase